MAKLNITSICKEIEKTLPQQEYALGKGLLQPFNNTNSGSRKIMQGTQTDQTMQLTKGEYAYISTGYENQYGKFSSTYQESQYDFVVVSKVMKFNATRHINSSNFTLILQNPKQKILHIVNRVDYRYISESYGYTLQTDFLDSLVPNDIIKAGEPLLQANSFDAYHNKCIGVNLTTVYMALAKTTEDPVILSQSAAEKLSAPLYDTTNLLINENDIMINMYGTVDNYKTFPDIGEKTKDGILCAIRREHKDSESFYAQSVENLRKLFFTDDKYMCNGTVVDIDVHCNNLEKLQTSTYNPQILKYYEMKLEYCRHIVSEIDPFISRGYKLTYEAEELYWNCKWTIEGKLTISDKVFSNIRLKIVTMNTIPVSIGDKITDRYGGKGVISDIWPDEMMPKRLKIFDGAQIWESAEAIYNNSTIINRENPGQSFETEINFINETVVDHIAEMLVPRYGETQYDEERINFVMQEVFRFLYIANPPQYNYLMEKWAHMKIDDKWDYLNSVIDEGFIYLVIPPMSNTMNIDTLAKLYEAFPYVEQVDNYVPQIGSDGQYRFVKANRKIIFGKKYITRLKQFAEEKFSAVSLASTNIRGENVKSNANKLHKVPHATTPVRFGDMEFLDMLHMNGEINIQILLLLCSAPRARMMFEKLLIGDPFVRNIKLPKDAVSRQVEKVDVYLKTIGLGIKFTKKLKRNPKLLKHVMRMVDNVERKDVMHLVHPYIQNNIEDIARERAIYQEEQDRSAPLFKEVPEELWNRLDGLPYEVKKEMMNFPKIQKSVNEICNIMDSMNDDELVQVMKGNYEKLIHDEYKPKPKQLFRWHVFQKLPGFDEANGEV